MTGEARPRSAKAQAALKLLAYRGSHAANLRVSTGTSARTQEHEERRDLSTSGDPRKMERHELIEDILLPALKARWLRMKQEKTFWDRVDQLDTEQVREWAMETLREHPWPPDLYIPTLFEFISKREYLDQTFPPSVRQTRAFQESIGESAWDWFVHKRTINLLVLCWGKGSGKDWLSACILAYVSFCVAQMRCPWFHFDVALSTTLDCINVAESGVQAKDVFYGYLRGMLESECFAGVLDQRPGGKGDIKADRVFFWKQVPGRRAPLRCLRILSLNSQSESVEGKNTFFWVMDEADAFRTAAGHANARDMFTKLTTSNRFADRQIGIIISYPRAKNGFMFAMLKECGNLIDPSTGEPGRRRNAWGDKAATWEVLPFKVFIRCKAPMPDPLRPGRIIEEAYTNPAGFVGATPDASMLGFWENDPEEFRRVYACDPPAAEDAFITYPEKIDEAVAAGLAAGLEPVAKVEPWVRTDSAGGVDYRYVALRFLAVSLRPGVTYYIGCDAGAKQDSFALAMFHAIPPGEEGYLCPECWVDRGLRNRKHYVPEEVMPVMRGKHASHFACDACKMLPGADHHFWGVAHRSGREVNRPVVKGYSQSGDVIYETEEYRDERGNLQRRQRTETVFLPLVVQDLLMEWQPDKREGLVVDFENVTDLIMQLCSTGQVGFVKIDQWQAEEKVQRLRRSGVPADTKQMSNPEQLKMYRNYKDLLYGNLLWLLPGEEKARKQLRELQDVNGTKVDHPKETEGGGKGAKDLCDAEAIAIQLAVEFGGRMGTVLVGRNDGSRVLDAQGRSARRDRQRRESIVGAELTGLGVRRGRRGS